jgi:outer membrane receptor protein involved in Fe transport
MKFIFISALCLAISITITAQNKPVNYQVEGRAIEKQTGKSIPYATITLQNDSLKIKKMQACDVSGHFSVTLSAPQKYTLTVSSVGYKQISVPVEIKELKTDLGDIGLEEGTEIKEITVTAQKPLVRTEVDKIVYSMESDPEAQTSNVLEMLNKVPLVTVDAEENISLKGQTNFKVLMNGKTSQMLSNNLKDVLKSLPANTVKDIEVITNPSSKYDAEGVGGIINIITVKKTINGYNGSISAGFDSRGSYNGSAYLAAKIGKFSFSGQFSGSQYKQPQSKSRGNTEYYNNTDYHYLNAKGESSYKGLSGNFSGEASYDIDSLNLISLSFWGYHGQNTSKSATESAYLNTVEDITRSYRSHTSGSNEYGSLSGNIDYQRLYKKPDKSLTFSYKLDSDPRKTNSLTNVEGIANYSSYRQKSDNDAKGREQTFQADYYNPLSAKHNIEGGVKYILRQNKSNTEKFLNDTIKLANQNDLDYDQYILGAYLGYVFKLQKFSTKSGLRMERTWNNGTSKSAAEDTKFTNRLINFVPYITLSYMPKAGQTIKLSYTQRLYRPGIWYLNPYVNNTDSMNISYGNPSLDAEVSNSFELSYSYYKPKFYFYLSSNASLVNNSIERIIKIKSNGATVSTYENIGKDKSYGLNLYASYRPNEKANIYFNGGLHYVNMEARSDYSIANKGFNFRGNFGGRLTLWKNTTFSAGGWYQSSSIMLQGKSSNYYDYNLSVTQYFLKRKLMLTLSATDPLNKNRTFSSTSNDATFYAHNQNTRVDRTLRFNVSYKFGKMDLQVKKARRGINNEDVKGGGESQGQ